MKRRDFNKAMGAVALRLAAGARAHADDTKKTASKAEDKAPKHICKGRNECKGNGGCKTGDAGCAGQELMQGEGRVRHRRASRVSRQERM